MAFRHASNLQHRRPCICSTASLPFLAIVCCRWPARSRWQFLFRGTRV